jgi:hypothetical protein
VKIGTKAHNFFSGNICLEFSVLCLCSAESCRSKQIRYQFSHPSPYTLNFVLLFSCIILTGLVVRSHPLLFFFISYIHYSFHSFHSLTSVLLFYRFIINSICFVFFLSQIQFFFIAMPVAVFIVPYWGIKSTMAYGCRTGPPAHVA